MFSGDPCQSVFFRGIVLCIALLCAMRADAKVFPKFAVAADHALASEAGAEILRKGGNAVDAAVATSFALSVVRPYSCGVGGGGFMVIHFKEDPKHGTKQVALNYREVAPGAVGPDYFEKLPEGASVRGGKAVGVPGTVAGLLHALQTYGTLDRATVLAPSIRLAEEGFTVDAHYIDSVKEVSEYIAKDSQVRQKQFAFVWTRFLNNGELKVGHRITLPEQARALRLIAEKGRAGFYEGELASAIVEAARATGGELTLEDLRDFKVVEGAPLRFSAFGRTFLSMPPPSSGGVAMGQTLKTLEKLDAMHSLSLAALAGVPGAAKHAEPAPGLRTHLVVESFKHAFADRARYMGDRAFVGVPVEHLLSDEYLDARAASITADRTLPAEKYGTTPQAKEDKGTSHFSVVDARGNAVACTETINLIFGSLVAVDAYGFCLNDEMDDFTTKRGAANAFGLTQSDLNLPAPGKRPLSSMTPTIVLDAGGNVEVTAGASGGPRIITGTTQAILNVLLRDDDALAALARPRLHHQWMPETLLVEEPYPAGVVESLKRLGHQTATRDAVANVQLIRRAKAPQTGWDAASDPRKGGEPAGE